MKRFPDFLQHMLDTPPEAGGGVHSWLYRTARNLHAHLPATEIVDLLEDRIANCGRRVPRNEIVAAVQNSIGCAWQPRNSNCHGVMTIQPWRPPASKWPPKNPERIEAVVRDNGGLADLWELSHPRIEDSDQHTEEIIDRLFPGNPLLCCGESQTEFDTRVREEWRGELGGLQFIVPSPMAARTGLTQEGKESAHCLNNTGPRRFLVCEFDSGTTDDHAAILIHLAGYAPMVCAVHSGGKSLHGWFYCGGQPEEHVLKFFRYAVSLGADSQLWTRSQFCRMPDGTRDNGNQQTVYFLNYKVRMQ